MTLGVFGSVGLLVMSCRTVSAMFQVFKARRQVRYSTTMPFVPPNGNSSVEWVGTSATVVLEVFQVSEHKDGLEIPPH
jgi:hypothetical protein